MWGSAGLRPGLAQRIAEAARQALEGTAPRDRLAAAGGIPAGNAPAILSAEIAQQRTGLAAAGANARIATE
jgi:hypothetical protein